MNRELVRKREAAILQLEGTGDPMKASVNQIRRCIAALGTYVKIRLMGQASEGELLAQSVLATNEITRIESLLNFHNPESELSQVNGRAHLAACEISPELAEVLGLSLHLSKITDGAFDITLSGDWRAIRLDRQQLFFERPLQMDLGGIAKGYAVDCAFSKISPEIDLAIEAGGDLRLRPWQGQMIALRNPDCTMPLFETEMLAAAVATSGHYFNEGVQRVIDRKTGLPTAGSHSVSVFASSCMLADALTKVGLLCPNPGELIQSQGGHLLVLDPARTSQEGQGNG